jgi:ribosomal protein S3AE
MAIAKKKNKFYNVEIPLIDKETQLIAMDISELDGKFIKYDLTRALRGKSVLLDLKVSVKDEKATSSPVGLNLVPYYIRRIVRKGTDYSEDSFITKCKNAEIKIKPILITRRKVSKSVRKALREKAKEEIEHYTKTKNYIELFDDILKNKMQKELSLKLKKIYPLSAFEIRILKVLKVLEDPKEEVKEEKTE